MVRRVSVCLSESHGHAGRSTCGDGRGLTALYKDAAVLSGGGEGSGPPLLLATAGITPPHRTLLSAIFKTSAAVAPSCATPSLSPQRPSVSRLVYVLSCLRFDLLAVVSSAARTRGESPGNGSTKIMRLIKIVNKSQHIK